MAQATRNGAIIMPPVPAFYALPATLDDVVKQTVARALELLDVAVPGITRWDGGAAAPDSNGRRTSSRPLTTPPRVTEHQYLVQPESMPVPALNSAGFAQLGSKRARIRERTQLPGRLADPLGVAILAIVVSAAGAARPSLWFDEAATISASTRSVPELWRLLHNIDAVHGLYYLAMHGWFAIFPATEFWSRLSSCLAIGIAAAGVVVVGKQFSTRTVAVCAGIVFAILPRITWAGIEARSYALTTAAAVWLTVLVVAAVRRNAATLWPLYGLALVVSTLLNVFVVLMVLVHAVVVAVVARNRSTVVWWAATSAVALLVVAPFMAVCRTQIAQVRWISPVQLGTFVEIVHEQYFDHSVPFALLAGLVLAAPLVLRRRRGTGNRQLAVIALAWIALPTRCCCCIRLRGNRSTTRAIFATPRPRWPCCSRSASWRCSELANA